MKTVIEMAREAGLLYHIPFPSDSHVAVALHRFANLVRADEREAMVAEAAKQRWAMKDEDPFEECVCEIAAIRARSNT